MKNRKSIFAFFAISAAMIFASCSNLTDANVSSSSSSEDKNTLNIEVTNYDEVVTQASKSANHASRTIIPESFESTGVDFFLYGTNTSGGTFGPEKVTFKGNAEAAGGTASKTVGTVSIPANSGVWEFTLVAVTSGDAAPTDATLKDDAVLIGYSSMDMLNGDTAKFTLSPDGLTKAASVAMKLYNDGWTTPTGYKITAGIYKLTDGADATITGDGKGTTTIKENLSLGTSAPADANYSLDSMTPGTYLFKVTFENTNSNKKFYWSDVLVVLPGKTIDNVVGIPNIIGTAPTAPTAFKAGYVENSEDKFSGWYTTAFEWERGSKNENNFELEVLEFNDENTVTPPANDTEWTTALTAGNSVTYGSKFSSEANYEGGSLLSGNTKAQLRLELGKRYFARIRAVNDAGESSWTLVALTDAPAEPTGTKKFTENTINRYRLRYIMNGGTYYTDKATADADTAGTGGSTADIVEYYCEDSAAGTAIKTADGTAGNPIIKKNTYTWSYWSTDGTSATASRYNEPGVAPENYKGYKNLDLYAMFTTDASVAIFDKKSLEIQDGWIALAFSGTPEAEEKATLTGKTATIEVTKQTEVKWTFTPGEVKDAAGNPITDFAYDKVNFTVTKGGTTFEAKSADEVGATKAAEFKMSLSNLPSGIYQVMFTAHYGTTTVSYPITAEITR